jgi:hypothetical protein
VQQCNVCHPGLCSYEVIILLKVADRLCGVKMNLVRCEEKEILCADYGSSYMQMIDVVTQ